MLAPTMLEVYIRCLYTYDPTKDTLLPTGHKGLAFRSGEVLELVDFQDLNWWQVRRLDNPNGKTSLIPSQTLEEKRQAFNQQITSGFKPLIVRFYCFFLSPLHFSLRASVCARFEKPAYLASRYILRQNSK
ncbi:unnamed protein product [Dibothriocephalus latus]|uniref:SH3 domain-containing protein n=1 Tax=Dibothriocephalus latus TaxID=60516 RepID=A0A3P7LW75_DIBLA|nr:unnamed protein product [Dibothriocephalus latus]